MDFQTVFETLGIKVEKLDKNYTPEEYGKKLIQHFYNGSDVSYSTYTSQNDLNKYVVIGKGV